jgi:hypothetical protein
LSHLAWVWGADDFKLRNDVKLGDGLYSYLCETCKNYCIWLV